MGKILDGKAFVNELGQNLKEKVILGMILLARFMFEQKSGGLKRWELSKIFIKCPLILNRKKF